MRVHVKAGKDGEQLAANLRGLLEKRGFQHSEFWPGITLLVDVHVGRTESDVAVSGPAGELESNIVHWITAMLEQGGVPRHVLLKRHGSIKDPRVLAIVLPDNDQVIAIAEQAIVAAVEVTLKGKTAAGAKRSVWGRIFRS